MLIRRKIPEPVIEREKEKKVKPSRPTKDEIEAKFAELYKYLDQKTSEFNEKINNLIKKDEKVHNVIASEAKQNPEKAEEKGAEGTV